MVDVTLRRRVAATGVGLVLFAGFTGVGPAQAAAAPEEPPVVTIRMDGAQVVVSGDNRLRAGLVTIEAATTEGAHTLWFYVPLPKVNAQKAKAAVAATRGVGAPARAAKAGAVEKQTATNARLAEESLIGLGGVYIEAERPGRITLQLPDGLVQVVDLAAEARGTAPIAQLKVGKPADKPRKASSDAQVIIDEDGAISAPGSMPRTGTVQLTNEGPRRWHYLGLQRLVEGATSESVSKFLRSGGTGDSPFDPTRSVGTAPLSAGRTQQLTYSVPEGRYVIIDAWSDSRTGKANAAQGAFRIVDME